MNKNTIKKIDHIVVIVPTYNEKDTIVSLLRHIQRQRIYLSDARLSVLVIDDNSPDGTAQFVRSYAKQAGNIHVLRGRRGGVGRAYKRGIHFAMRRMYADIIIQMDATLSQDPSLIPFFVREIKKGSDMVIGSRYVNQGSTPQRWSASRKAKSTFANGFAKFITGIKSVSDCTSTYRAYKTSLVKRIGLKNLHSDGYSFTLTMLYHAIKRKARIKEIPLRYQKRYKGYSKNTVLHAPKFALRTLFLKMPFLYYVVLSVATFVIAFAGFSLGLFVSYIAGLSSFSITFDTQFIIISIITLFVLAMSSQSIFNIFLLIYAWEDAERIEEDAPPKTYEHPKYSFTALVPARNEELVVMDTIKAINAIDYPEHLKETLVICRTDDYNTIRRAEQIIYYLNKKNVRLVLFNDLPINKPHSLNKGLKYAKKDIVVVFDAEDQPSRNIYNIANTQMIKKNLDVLQSGVQLMNFRSSWYATFNVLEYFFWFKSALHFFAKKGVIPLGGNTVFFKRRLVQQVGGWDETCLTEDAEIGFRMSQEQARVGVVYDEKHTTQEETPHSLGSFIKQRTRWNQGFIQILQKGDWKSLDGFGKKFLAAYILLLPQLQALFFFMIPISIATVFFLDLPLLFALMTIVPLLLLFIQLIIYMVGLFEFTRGYKLSYPFWMPLQIILMFYPFQFLLGISATRALLRFMAKDISWEKTLHMNTHRKNTQIKPALK